ncbi:MAG: ABC transporter permease subunit [Burkholderiales bacterium]|jgi:NitT/TauT family transport system permease protein|nr:ABC transporter permease subunit [Burkholderiales bacterium]
MTTSAVPSYSLGGRVARGVLFPLAVLVFWEFAARSGLLKAESLSYPTAIFRAAVGVVIDGTLFKAAAQTFGGALGGLAVGATAGILVGVAFGLSRTLSQLMRVSTESLRPIPSVALIPLALLIHGYGFQMESSIVAFSCFWPLLIITESAVRGIEPRLIEVARVLGFGAVQRVTKIVLPAALPRIFVGLRLAAAVSLVVAVTVEITANPQGLGYALVVAQESMRPDRVFAFIGWIGLIGWAFNAALLRAQTRWFGRMGNWAETSS